jgi:uncharacterized protein YukE
MSFLLLLNEDELEKIVPLLPKYEIMVENAKPIFELEGRRLEEIARTLPKYQSSYDQAHQEMKALEDWVNNIKEKKTAKLWKKYNEGYQKALSARDIQAYIAGEKDIVETNQIIIEVLLIKNQLNAIVEALKNLGWMVGHITKIRVAELQETIL